MEIEEAKAKRQRAIEYGNSALKATTRVGQLKELRKQARVCERDRSGVRTSAPALLTKEVQHVALKGFDICYDGC